MNLDLARVPFSCAGAYFSIRRRIEACLTIQTVSGAALWSDPSLFHLELVDGNGTVEFVTACTPSVLRMEGPRGVVEVAFDGDRTLRLRGRGAGVRLTRAGGGLVTEDAAGRWRIAALHRTQWLLEALRGRLDIDAPWTFANQHHSVPRFVATTVGDDWELLLQEYEGEPDVPGKRREFDACVMENEAAVEAFTAKLPPVPHEYADARRLAGYVLWSSLVSPRGLVRRPTMLMSKNWMYACWSWDHCFNALALGQGDPELARDQLLTIFDHQAASGGLPDYVSNDHLVWGFCKPPIHGWAVRRMMRGGWAGEQLPLLYDHLERATDWWLLRRDDVGDGLPVYRHGNDCGWDNSTVFDLGAPVQSPDLLAFLALQTEVLAELAGRLGRGDAERRWRDRSEGILASLLSRFWTGDRFVARLARTGEPIASESTLLHLPLVLGRRLPADVLRRSLARLKGRGGPLTEHGLATEPPTSEKFIPNGYWRGAIWAPTTLLVIDGVADAGELELARQMARSFCDMCRTGGFAENFNALTGEPLRDPAYTWTASVFLSLASEFCAKGPRD